MCTSQRRGVFVLHVSEGESGSTSCSFFDFRWDWLLLDIFVFYLLRLFFRLPPKSFIFGNFVPNLPNVSIDPLRWLSLELPLPLHLNFSFFLFLVLWSLSGIGSSASCFPFSLFWCQSSLLLQLLLLLLPGFWRQSFLSAMLPLQCSRSIFSF